MIKIVKPIVRDEDTGRLLEHAEGRCVCGKRVLLDSHTCSCACGREYNLFGQELAPREQWGEETGETAADMFNERDPEEVG